MSFFSYNVIRRRAIFVFNQNKITMKKLFYSFIFFMIFQSSYAQPGSVDLSFGNNGSIIYNDNFIISNSLIQPDGKIAVMGYEAGVANAVIKRYHLDGGWITSFKFHWGLL